VSKERARRREAREREAAVRAAARAADQERRERRAAHTARWRRLTGRLSPPRRAGHQSGPLAQKRRIQTWLLVSVLVFVNVLVWAVRPDWAARLGALVVSILAAPVLATLLFRRR